MTPLLLFYGSLVDIDFVYGFISFVVVCIIQGWRKGNEASSVERYQYFAAGHVLEPTIGLQPVLSEA